MNISFIKKAGALVCALALGLGVLAGCSNGTEATDSTDTTIANPIVTVDSADAFSALGVKIDAPEGATDVSYYTISGEIAGVEFTCGTDKYVYRASATQDDISGIYYELNAQYQMSIADMGNGDEIEATVYAAEDKGIVVEWAYDGVNYALWHEGELDGKILSQIFSKLVEISIPASDSADEQQQVEETATAAPVDFSAEGTCTADLDGDGTNETITLSDMDANDEFSDYMLVVTTADGTEYKAELDFYSLSAAYAYDFDACGKTELFISGTIENDYGLSFVARFDGTELVFADPEIPEEPFDDVDDTDEDEMPEPDTSFDGIITLVQDNAIAVMQKVDVLGTYMGTTTYKMDADAFRFAKDPETVWTTAFDASSDDSWEFASLTTAAEFPVRMDGTQEDSALPVGTEIGITEVNTADSITYTCRFVTRAGEEGTLTTVYNTGDIFGFTINGVSEYECFTYVPYAG